MNFQRLATFLGGLACVSLILVAFECNRSHGQGTENKAASSLDEIAASGDENMKDAATALKTLQAIRTADPKMEPKLNPTVKEGDLYKTVIGSLKAIKAKEADLNPQKKLYFDFLKEQTLKEIGYYYTRAMYHDKTANLAIKVTDQYCKEIAGTEYEKKLCQNLKKLGESIEKTPPTESNRWDWHDRQRNRFADDAADVLPKDFEDVHKEAPAAVKKLHSDAQSLYDEMKTLKKTDITEAKKKEIIAKLESLKNGVDTFNKRIKELQASKAKAKTPDELKKATEDIQDAAEKWKPTLMNIGNLIVRTYSLISDWNNKSDLEKIRDVVKVVATALEVAQLALSAPAPYKLVIVAILNMLAQLLDFGIDLFPGNREPPPGGGDLADEKKRDAPAPGGDKAEANAKGSIAGKVAASSDPAQQGSIGKVQENATKDKGNSDKLIDKWQQSVQESLSNDLGKAGTKLLPGKKPDEAKEAAKEVAKDAAKRAAEVFRKYYQTDNSEQLSRRIQAELSRVVGEAVTRRAGG